MCRTLGHCLAVLDDCGCLEGCISAAPLPDRHGAAELVHAARFLMKYHEIMHAGRTKIMLTNNAQGDAWHLKARVARLARQRVVLLGEADVVGQGRLLHTSHAGVRGPNRGPSSGRGWRCSAKTVLSKYSFGKTVLIKQFW